MTQGWRDFVWKRIADTTFNYKYDVSQSITVSGRVSTVVTGVPLAGMVVTMFVPGAADDKMFVTKTDSTGEFLLDGLTLYGAHYAVFTSRSDIGKRRGWIKVDSLWTNDMMPIRPPHYYGWRDTLANDIKNTLVKRGEQRRKFSFTENNQLNEVEIRSKTKVIPDRVFNITQKDFETERNPAFLLVYLAMHIRGAIVYEDKDTKEKTLTLVRAFFKGVGLIKDDMRNTMQLR